MKYGIELQELRKYWCGRDGKALKSKDDILGGGGGSCQTSFNNCRQLLISLRSKDDILGGGGSCQTGFNNCRQLWISRFLSD